MSWDHADNWTDASTQPAQERSNPTHGGSVSMVGGLTMCELSINVGNSKVNRTKVTEVGAMIGATELKIG